jgi:hypothetical protein
MRLRNLAVVLALAGCASQPQPAADGTPQNPTAVFETRVSSSGIAGVFPFETTEKHYVRANMRRDEHAGKGTGTFSGFLVTRLMGPGDTTIARLDRNVRWTLDHAKKEYTECPVHGCPQPPRAGKPAQPERREEPKQKAEEHCVVRIASSKFDVKATGQKQTLNGFPAEEYRMAWVVRLQDRQKRTTTSTVNVDVWTTPESAQMRRALDTESAFDRAFAAAAPRVRAPRAGEPHVMPPDMLRMMTAYLAGLTPSERASLQRTASELNKVKGHPIQTKIDWLLDGNACGAKDEPQPASQSGGGDMMSGLTSLFGAKKEESAGPKPLLSFTIEVKQLGVVPVHDSVFAVPAGYKLVKFPE